MVHHLVHKPSLLPLPTSLKALLKEAHFNQKTPYLIMGHTPSDKQDLTTHQPYLNKEEDKHNHQ